MGRRPIRRTEVIEVEIEGELYRGERIVTGLHELHQEVRFEALRERDRNDYDADDELFMRDIAKLMLRDLVDQWKRQGARRPLKVEPERGPSKVEPKSPAQRRRTEE